MWHGRLYPRPWRVGLVLLALLPACGGTDARLQAHEESLASLRATANEIGMAWVAGRVSTTFAVTALEQTATLVDAERRGLANPPETLADARVAALAADAEQLSRLVGRLLAAIHSSDRGEVRHLLAGRAVGEVDIP